MLATKAPPRESDPILRRPTNADYKRMVGEVIEEMDSLTDRLASGKLTVQEWADEFDALLGDAHTDAFVLGRMRAGDLTERSIDDEIFGIAAKDGQSQFLRGFSEALEAGDERYFGEDGALRKGPVMNRMKQYAARLRGTANEAFVAAGEDDDAYTWALGPTEHCPDCIELAALSPYTRDTMLGHPGDGNTECRTNCACRLIRTRGDLACFSRPDIYED